MRTFKSFVLASTMVGSLAGLAFSAYADDAPKPADAPKVEDAKAKAKKAEKKTDDVQEIVVTGSHLHRKDLNTASPVLTITAESAELQGSTSVADLLQKLPQASSTQQTNSLLGGYVVTGGAGVETLSLFGLGADRTLVLLNGRRLGPAGVGATVGPVDLNVLPLDALQQVDIQLDGSSSVYGSDAIGGVVNFITKKNTDGLELIVHGTQPFQGHGGTNTVSIVDGITFDKGYVSILASENEDTGLRVGDRDDTKCAADYIFNPSNGSRADFLGVNGQPKCFNALNNSFQAYNYGGEFQWAGSSPAYNYPADGLNLSAYLPGWVRAGRAGHPDTYPYENSDASVLSKASVIEPVKTDTLLFTGGYDISPTASLYTEILYNRRQSVNDAYYQLFPWVDPTNPVNTVGQALGGDYTRPIILYNASSKTDVEYTRAVIGLKGAFAGLGFLDGFKYDGYYQVSSDHGTYGQNFVYNDRVNATTAPGVACDPTQMTVSPAPCVTINWFDPNTLAGNFTAQQKAFLFGWETEHTDYVQQAIEYNITGDVYRLPAGVVSAVVGIYLKDDQMEDTPGYNAQNYNYWGFTTSGVTKGHYNSEELYGELYTPLVKNVFLIKNLDLTLSGRVSDYSNYGTNETYKTGAVWNITNEYALHATYGDSYRAPTIYEQHLANQTSFTSLNDPCVMWAQSTSATVQARCAAQGIPSNYGGALQSTEVFQGGGPNLKPETSTNSLLGGTWSPAFANLKITADYNFIKLKNTITNFGSQNIVNACYYGVANYQYYCSLFQRDSNNDIVTVNDNYINIGRTLNRNISLKIDYKYNTPWGRFSAFLNSSWQITNKSSLGGTDTDYTGSVGSPVFTNHSDFNFKSGDYTYHWGVDMYGKASDLRYYTGGNIQYNTNYPDGYGIKAWTEFYAVHTVAISRQYDKFRVTVGVDNVFDTPAPNLSTGEFRVGTAALNMYDLRGRTAYVTLDKRF